MEATQIAALAEALLLLLVLLLYIGFRRKGFCTKRYGPRSFPVVGSLFSFWKNGSRHIEWYTEMLANSPTHTIVLDRLGAVRTVVTANPANVEYILKTRFENYPKGEPFTAILYDLLGRGIFNSDGKAWMMQRKVASHQFSTKSLRNFVVEVVEEATERMVDILEGYAIGSEIVDLQDILQRFAFDNVCKVAFGIEGGCLDARLPSSELGQALDVASRLCSLRAAEPVQLVWKVKRLFRLGSERQLAEAARVVHGFAEDVIRRRRSEMDGDASPKQQDLLSRFMVVEPSEEFLRDIIISFVLAGRDTTSAALVWFFWLLSSHPPVEAAIHEELVSLLARRPVQKIDTERRACSFSYEELQSMQYLHAAISESMRLYPPVLFDSKHALHDDVLPDGTSVERGTRVTYHPYAMGRMKSLWGADCEEFKPERWLNEKGLFVPESPFKYAVFQGGMRMCLGKDMAFIQMKYVAASVIGRFSLRPVGWPTLVHSLTARMADGLPVMVQRRPQAGGSLNM